MGDYWGRALRFAVLALAVLTAHSAPSAVCSRDKAEVNSTHIGYLPGTADYSISQIGPPNTGGTGQRLLAGPVSPRGSTCVLCTRTEPAMEYAMGVYEYFYNMVQDSGGVQMPKWGEGVGLTAGGMPVGDEVYVNDVLKKDAVEVGAQIEKIILKLHNHSAQALQCLGNYCNQTLLQHQCAKGIRENQRFTGAADMGMPMPRLRRGPCARSAMTSSLAEGRATEGLQLL